VNTFALKNRQNRKFYNPLTAKDMLRVFKGSTGYNRKRQHRVDYATQTFRFMEALYFS
jgi:hypothetical protein